MKPITKNEISETLAKLGISNGDSVFIHSSLFTLGKIEGVDIPSLPEALLFSFQQAIGSQGSIFMPCFNYEFPKTRVALLSEQKCELGYWPEWFRTQSYVVRSGHPMFSICGLGPIAERVCKPTTPEFHAFGEGSTFSRLIEEDCILVLQGIGLKVATVVVQIEKMLGMQYRFDKPFFGRVTLTNDNEVEGNYFHYCFPMNNAYREDYSYLEKSLLKEGLLKLEYLGRSFIMTIRMKQLYERIKLLTASSRFVLLNTSPTYLYKYDNGNELPYRLDN